MRRIDVAMDGLMLVGMGERPGSLNDVTDRRFHVQPLTKE